MKYGVFIVLFLFFNLRVFSQDSSQIQARKFEIVVPSFVLSGVPFKAEIVVKTADGRVDSTYSGTPKFENLFIEMKGEQRPITQSFEKGKLIIEHAVVGFSGSEQIKIRDDAIVGSVSLRSVPGILSILPALFAIVLALVLRQVIISLFAGVWLGALFIYGYNPFVALLRVVDKILIEAISSTEHVMIIVFSMMFGGVVGIISRNGGTLGIADQILRLAKNARRTQIGAWILGIVIFFDDYANTLIVGNTMRPLTDKLKISREKLAYIVDSTAAPVSSLFFISTWIGYEVGLIDSAIESINYHVESAYWIFLDTIPFRFYPILTLIFGFLVAATGRDWGPMLRAERRSRKEGKLYRDGAQLTVDLTDSHVVQANDTIPRRWYNGAIPILTVLVAGVVSLYVTGVMSITSSGGSDFSLGNIIGSADSYRSLLWAAFASCLVAIILTLSQRLLTVSQTIEAWFQGVKSMLFAMLILILAWSIGGITKELHTAEYMVQILKGHVDVHWLAVLTFIISAYVSFATGTSWGTMGILMPIVIPLAAALSAQSGLDIESTHRMMLGTVSSVLAGSVFGDHCSPISDTTILSSMASACDHIDHVRTQLPYAILVAFVGMIAGDIPTAFGFSPYLSVLLGTGVLVGFLYVFGKRVE